MRQTREIKQVVKSQPTIEGAGVHLKRAFGFSEVPNLDPFLLLDDFRSNDPKAYSPGFPWHPHRGIETITYVIEGQVEHGDSLGNRGVISSGDVQWMSAGSGIIHQEMPKGDADGRMGGFQLWANLPAAQKMSHPTYREVKSRHIPRVDMDSGATVRIVCGTVAGQTGPVKGVFIEPEYIDVILPPQAEFSHPTQRGHTVFAYVIEGQAFFTPETRSSKVGSTGAGGSNAIGNESLVLYQDGDRIQVSTREDPVRFLLISGKPLKEPIAWQGPIVMNTQAELRTAFEEYRQGTFIKHA